MSAEPARNVAASTSASKPIESARATRPLASPSSAASAFAKGAAKIDTEDEGAKVVANGSARSVSQSSIPSDAPLQSINDIETHLETPPRDRHFAEFDQPQTEQQKLGSRSDRDGFMGFCPVTLRDHKSLVDGLQEFTTVYREATFTFATSEAKAIFDADPDRYAPANQGRDVVLAAGQISVAGSLRHATYYRNRLYLFRSEQTCGLFVADPARYVTDAEADPIR
ncbi:MAG: hypothetical protein H0T47_21235 [Planctomycetaceae bacterium]|nr:hypothetical protein [Planctomycetaceae bacterium]